MKTLFLLIGLILLGCSPQKENHDNGYIIHGEATGFKEGTVLYLIDPDTQKNIDSIEIVHDAFQFKGNVEQPKNLFLATKYNGNRSDFKYKSFWVDNGEINFKGNFRDFKYAAVNGMEIHEIDNKLSALLNPYYRKEDSISVLYEDEHVDRKIVSSKIEMVRSTIDSITKTFVLQYPNNYLSLSQVEYLKDKFSREELNTIYNALDENLKQTEEGKNIIQYLSIDKIIEKGDQIADIVGNTLSGEQKNLVDIVNQHRFTILDFWESSCYPCRKQSRQYRVLHEKYRDKGLAIVSFSLDKNKELWKKASIKDSISWVNISDLKGINGISSMKYGVKMIPNCFLIDQDGQVVAELNGYDSEKMPFEDKLLEVFD